MLVSFTITPHKQELNIDLTSEGEGTEPRAVIPSGSSDADESSSTTDEDDDERMGGEPLAGLAHVAPSVSAPAMVVEPARPPPPPAVCLHVCASSELVE